MDTDTVTNDLILFYVRKVERGKRSIKLKQRSLECGTGGALKIARAMISKMKMNYLPMFEGL